MSKKLYVIVKDGGDGSTYPSFTFNTEFITKVEELCDADIIGYEEGYGDGDGFHYEILYVPDECTPESMGFRDCAYDLSMYSLEDDEEEE